MLHWSSRRIKGRRSSWGRKTRSKSKQYSPQASLSGNSTNVPLARLEKRSRTTQSNCTQSYLAHFRENHHKLLLGNRNVLTITNKVMELAEEGKNYHLAFVEVSFTKRCASIFVDLDSWWTLFYSGADLHVPVQTDMEILSSPQFSDCWFNWILVEPQVCMLKFNGKGPVIMFIVDVCFIAVRKYQTLADDVLQFVVESEYTIILNTHIGTDNKTWKSVIGSHREFNV